MASARIANGASLKKFSQVKNGLIENARVRLMAFRIHDSVVRDEIDNRVRGTVGGNIWLEGRSEPLILELSGNAHPDIAGCLLTLTNPLKRVLHPQLDSLKALQRARLAI